MTILFTEPSFVPVSGNSVVYPGAKLYFYATETSTPQNTYSEYTLTTAHANPVVADADGRFAPIYLDPNLEDYKVVLKDSSDVTIWTVDPYSAINNTTRLGTMSDLLSASTALGTVSINGYRTAGDGGGGEFYWDASQDKANHNAITIIDPDRTYPSDWGNATQVTAWFTAGTGTGCWMRVTESTNVLIAHAGAIGSGTETTQIQAALNLAATNGAYVLGEPGKTYTHAQLTVKNGTRGFLSNGATFKPNGTTNASNLTTEAAVVLQGALTGGTAVDKCVISLDIDMQSGDRTAILGDGCTDCVFENCKIYGFTNDATNNHRGIRLQEGASYNRIVNNEIVGFTSPTQRGLLIDVYGSLTGFLNFGDYFSGTPKNQPTPAVGNIISNNVLKEGSYSVSLQGCEYTDVSNNIMENNNHRGMWVGNGSWHNTITGNTIKGFTSSAILLGYSCSYNLIAGNHCRNEGATGLGGEAAININTGSSYNLITGNHLDAPVNYGVYIGPDSSYNVVDGNYSKNAYVAAFAAENDWIDTLPTNNFYGRPNYSDPDTTTGLANPPASSWTFNNLEGNVFQNNVVHSGYTGRSIAAFYLGQVENDFVGATATDHIGTVLRNNKLLTMTNVGYGLYVHEHVADQMSGIEVYGNSWPSAILATTADFAGANTTSATLDVRDVGVDIAFNNGKLDQLIQGTAIAFTNGDTTPDVSNWNYYKCANTGSTTITDFNGATEGKEIVIQGDANTDITHNPSVIYAKGAASITTMTANSLIAFKSIGGIWYEMWRNF